MKTKTIVSVAVLMLATVALTYWLGYQHGNRSTMLRVQSVEPLPVTGFSREAVLRMLHGKTWYWHWETKDRKRPNEISVNDDGQIFVGATGKNLKLELRWVLNEGDHLFVPVDDYTLRGFFIASGRQTGMFSDKPQ